MYDGSQDHSRVEVNRSMQSSYPSGRLVVSVPSHPATPPTPPIPVDRGELFLGFSGLCTASHFALGHVAGKTTDVVLEDLVLVFQLIVVGLDRVNALGEGLERGLESLGLPGVIKVSFRVVKTDGAGSISSIDGHSLLKRLAGLLAQSLQISRITAGTHSASVVRRKFFLFNFNFGVVPGNQNGSRRLSTRHARAFRASSAISFGVRYG